MIEDTTTIFVGPGRRFPIELRFYPHQAFFNGRPDVPRWKKNVRAEVRAAVRRGELTMPTKCEGCGVAGQLDGHHHDHERVLEVVWVCERCHGRLHRQAAALAFGLARRHGFPRDVPLVPWITVCGGRAGWIRFLAHAREHELGAACFALAQFLRTTAKWRAGATA